ncbi:hypothetical protein ACLBXM_11205 [Xanthobacteraceae bacterium A53D]
MKFRLIALLAAALAVSGCIERMTKPGASQQDFDVALERCKADAYIQVPVQMISYEASPGSWQKGPETCNTSGPNGAKVCTSIPVWKPPVVLTRDANSDARETVTRACLQSDGWR